MTLEEKWGYESGDGEQYWGCYDTPEEAANASGAPVGAIVEVGQYRNPMAPETVLVAEAVFEQLLCEDDYQSDWADGYPHCTKDQEAELTAMLRQAFATWLEKHDLRPHWGIVTTTQKVVVTKPYETKP
jgi:hypothetical protein